MSGAALVDTPLGDIWFRLREGRLVALGFDHPPDDAAQHPELARQLEEYLAGRRRRFDVELALEGTPFQLEVWAALQTIPHGQTRSYAWLAEQVGSVARAVGSANGANPVGILVPCHRVIGADGSLTGYAGGLWRKRWLLQHEAAQGSLF